MLRWVSYENLNYKLRLRVREQFSGEKKEKRERAKTASEHHNRRQPGLPCDKASANHPWYNNTALTWRVIFFLQGSCTLYHSARVVWPITSSLVLQAQLPASLKFPIGLDLILTILPSPAQSFMGPSEPWIYHISCSTHIINTRRRLQCLAKFCIVGTCKNCGSIAEFVNHRMEPLLILLMLWGINRLTVKQSN